VPVVPRADIRHHRPAGTREEEEEEEEMAMEPSVLARLIKRAVGDRINKR